MVGLEDIGDGDHQVERLAVVAAALTGGTPESLTELEQLKLLQPGALLKRGKGMPLRLLLLLVKGLRGRSSEQWLSGTSAQTCGLEFQSHLQKFGGDALR
ncbi:MAG: hypothetical protein ACKOE9_10175, partial [Vulcanococcus sp.]